MVPVGHFQGFMALAVEWQLLAEAWHHGDWLVTLANHGLVTRGTTGWSPAGCWWLIKGRST